jgi:hypothetical protein
MARIRARIVVFVLIALLALAAPASALETRLTELRVAGGSVRASFELKDMFPAKFQSVLEQGAAIYLRMQVELWEDRLVWDKLAQPAVMTVFRIVMDPATRQVRIADKYGEVSRQPAWQEPVTLWHDLGRADALSDGAKYYIRAIATLGTNADTDTAQASKVVFGDDDNTVSLAGMGKMLFHAVLQANDYLQSATSETRSRGLAGRELKAGIKIQ